MSMVIPHDPLPPMDVKGKGTEGATKAVVTREISPPVVSGVVIQERVGGLETDIESIKVNPLGTSYTRRVLLMLKGVAILKFRVVPDLGELKQEWTVACVRFNRDLKAVRDEVINVTGERDAESREVQRLSTMFKEKEAQTIEAQKSHAEALACLANRLMASEELAKYMFELGGAAYNSGRKDCYAEGKVFAIEGNQKIALNYSKKIVLVIMLSKHKAFGFLKFSILKAIEKLSRKGVAVVVLRKVLEGGDAKTGGVGPSGSQS
ncbi:hypothetical protein Hanom_Chr09g00791931 [Helianthus anomalus]